MNETDELAVSVNGVDAGYENEVVLKDVNFKVEENDFYGIIGPNGGGKTTLLKVILGLLDPFNGDVRIYGEPPSKSTSYIGYVPQYAEFDEDYPISVFDVALMGRRNKKGLIPRYSDEDRDKVREALDSVGMLEMKDKNISKLSGGQKQRVFIARALSSEPKILLLDEPTASIDQKIKESIYELLNKLNQDLTILFVTHDVGAISEYVNKLACLNKHLYTHNEDYLSTEMLEDAYQCPVELITHEEEEIPHRVITHEE